MNNYERNKEFIKYCKAAKIDPEVTYDSIKMKSFQNIVDCIFDDIERMPHHTFDGRFQDLLCNLLSKENYEITGYECFIKELEEQFKKLIVPTVLLVPLNFVDSSVIKKKFSIKRAHISVFANI